MLGHLKEFLCPVVSITVSEELTQLKQRTIMAMKKMTSTFETYRITFVFRYVPSKSTMLLEHYLLDIWAATLPFFVPFSWLATLSADRCFSFPSNSGWM